MFFNSSPRVRQTNLVERQIRQQYRISPILGVQCPKTYRCVTEYPYRTVPVTDNHKGTLVKKIVVGDFLADMPGPDTAGTRELSSIEFIDKAYQSLSNLQGLVLSDDEINSIQCYLTGQRNTDGGFSIKRYFLHDKHGLTRHIYNAEVNIYRQQAGPIYLGVQDKEMQTLENDHTGETVSPAAE